jgi:hypothetical protein
MKRRSSTSPRVHALLAALCVLGIAAAGIGCSRTPPKPLDLVVLHTNDAIGYLEPCG